VAYAALDGEGEASEDCQPKVADCIDFENFNPTPDQLEQLGEFRDVDPNQACWEDFRGAFGGLPMVKPECR
jgi:hypothetical protein